MASQTDMPPAADCHRETPEPSLELALVCLHIAAARDRSWLSGPVSGLIPEGGPSLERLSRLKARLLGEFEQLLGEATRPGRPARHSEPQDESLVLRELCALVPREFWSQLPRERQQELVAAQLRLKERHGLTQTQFCELLGLSERTFRSWKEKKPELPTSQNAQNEGTAHNDKHSAAAPTATGRFDLTATMPGIQLMADTTRWEFFGVPLYVVALQDPGARKQRLWESFAVDLKEDSELIVSTVEAAARPGAQFVCDQGSPYMSQFTREALASFESEHAPQKEGAPTEKATKERAFRTVKQALAPLSELSRRIAERVPALRNPAFARAVGRVALSCFLRVYESAARHGAHPLQGRGPEELEAIAEEQREKARAQTRSVRLALEAIHRDYRLPGSAETFIGAYRSYALEDILEAERRMRSKAGSAEIKAIGPYFAGILRNVQAEMRPKRQQERQQRIHLSEQRRRLTEQRRQQAQRAAVLRDHPEVILAEGLDMLAAHWIAPDRLFAAGHGLGRARVRQALESMAAENPHRVRDRAEAVWTAWVATSGGPQQRVDLVRALFEDLVDSAQANAPPSPSSLLTAHKSTAHLSA